jgi:hypothetical protein
MGGMQALVFADITNRRLSSTPGGSALNLPALVQGDSMRLGLRLTETIEVTVLEVARQVVSLRASLGFIDARPASGAFVLRVGAAPFTEGVNQTEPLHHDANAATVQAALAAIGLSEASVIRQDGSWIITRNGQQVDLSGASAPGLAMELKPLSFVRVRSSQVGGSWRYEVRLVQAPLASTAGFENLVPPAPTVTRVQEGGSSATTVWPEIQALRILPTFRGTYQLRRGFRKTGELSIEDGPEELQAALAAIADDEGTFAVTNPTTNIAHITFGGAMTGIAQDLIQLEVFSAPAGDPTFTLDLNTAEIAASLRATDEIRPMLEIELVVRDEHDPDKTHTLTPFRAPVTVVRELNWEGLETAANIDWLRPPHGTTYVPFTPDQIITGSQHYVAPIGDGMNTEFTISHNLGTRDLHVTVRQNGGSCAIVEPLSVTLDGEDDLSITFAAPPVVNGYVVSISTAGPVSAFQAHGHTIAQIEGLQLILDDLGGRVESLEQFIPAFGLRTDSTEQQIIAAWELPDVFEVFPTRQKITATDVPSIKIADLPRVGGLLPAVYDVDGTTPFYALVPTPLIGQVYQYTGAPDPLVLPGYLGRKSTKLKTGDLYAWDGRGFYQVEKMGAAETVYYPKDFSRELFRIHVNGKQLRLGKALALDFSFVAAVFNSNASVQWGVAIDIGLPSASPSSPANLADLTFLAPSLDHTFMLTAVPSAHNFGLRVTRKLVNAVETFAVDRVIYGATEAADTSLSTANFIVRGRLCRFDTDNNQTDPRGLIAFNGLKATLSDEGASDFGKATIQ